jgi:hyperosmotically inducible protein
LKKTLAISTLLGILLIGATAANAADTQADWTTMLNVKMALLEKLGSDSLHMEVDSTKGAVTLTGTVDKRETMELASTVAKTVPGVIDVQNNVKLEAAVVNPSKPGKVVGETDSEVKDAMLETRLRLALIDSLGNDGFHIGTDVASGVVTLAFDHDLKTSHRERAVTVAKGVSGVSKVISLDKTAVAKTKR